MKNRGYEMDVEGFDNIKEDIMKVLISERARLILSFAIYFCLLSDKIITCYILLVVVVVVGVDTNQNKTNNIMGGIFWVN